jgi:hypothetical protein
MAASQSHHEYYCDEHNCIVAQLPCPYCKSEDHEAI